MKINYYGVLSSPSGYGIVSRETGRMVRRLLNKKIGVVDFPSPWGETPITDPEMVSFFTEGYDYYKDADVGVAFSIPESLNDITPDKPFVQGVKHWILHTAFEGTRVSDTWASAVHSFRDRMGMPIEHIIVPSTANKEAFKGKIDNVPISVVPHGLSDTFKSLTFSRQGNADRRVFSFIAIFDWLSCWRKGIDILLEAYVSEFKPEEPVRLILKSGQEATKHIGFVMQSILAKYQLNNTPLFELLFQPISETQLIDLYKLSDCYVAPFRAEGFGLPITEAMATALPVIATKFDGPVDYLTDFNSFLLDIDCMISAEKEGVFYTDAFWAQPSLTGLKRLMRFVYGNRDYAIKKGEIARKDAKKFSWKRAAQEEIAIYQSVMKNEEKVCVRCGG